MAYKNIVLASSATLSSKDNQLIIKSDCFNKSIPIEDISCVMVESHYVSISSYVLSKFSDYGVTLFVCNKEHLPTAVMLPINTHSRQLKMINLQYNQTKPFLKRLWQQIIISKIENQSRCLEFCGIEGHEKIRALRSRVQSGDTTNVEAIVASKYFKMLFGKDFTRSIENTTNAALNYGYSILRGVIARNLATYGFETSLGIHHCSELNNFNLADDIIEPFRPVVDLFVALNIGENEDFTPEIKHNLFNLLNVDIKSGDKNHSVAYAIEKSVQSLSSCYNKVKEELVLPELAELRLHRYE
ncbi:MAG: type II CRISPR-associated endonuclease Cas1 [Acutalibacteraceae bacterium]|jgi:CRISPR-associated protein Cas1